MSVVRAYGRVKRLEGIEDAEQHSEEIWYVMTMKLREGID
jgi:hypothetical protein